MRGRTLNNSFVLIDEAQNCTYGQIKMLLTKLGWHSTMEMTGDPDQTDLLPELSGLASIAQKLDGLDDVAVVRLTDKDVCAIRWSDACCRCCKATELTHTRNAADDRIKTRTSAAASDKFRPCQS